MKKSILTVLALLPLFSFAQSKIDSVLSKLPIKDGNLVYEKITPLSVSASELFINAKKWIATNYVDYKSVVKLDDEKTGTIIFKGNSNFGKEMISYRLHYTCEINTKSDKFRVIIKDISINQFDNFTKTLLNSPIRIEDKIIEQKNRSDGKSGWFNVFNEANLFMDDFIKNLSATINKKSDW